MIAKRLDQAQGVTLFLVEEFTHLVLSCVLEPLRIANLLSGTGLYRWRLASKDGEQATCSNGTTTLVEAGMDPVPKNDLFLLVSGINVDNHITRELLSYVRRERARGTRIGALCSAPLILARAGLLDGQRASIHWEFHDRFEEEFPRVQLSRSVFVADARYPTASGGTATADLMLHLIGETHGYDLSVAVADQMVYNAVRSGTAAQRVSIQARNGMRNAHVAEAIRLMGQTTDAPISPKEIARQIGITTRQLERLFKRYMRRSPKRYGTELRLEKARNLLLQTEISVTEIACACGFDSSSHFSRVYRAHFGVAPTTQRPHPL